MKANIWPAAKRFIRILIAGAIAGAISSAVTEMHTWQVWIIIQPGITALISALVKYIRHKWGIELPL